ncbi:MAG TPA: segregation/condensation protein A [Streptosporangiaceae bacterium]|nr:segregation/condensation protein A [Streptosporangiaceae bacterium]
MLTGGPADSARVPAAGGFEVHLDVFEGPFDLLLALIGKHKLDITEIALSRVTDEFIKYISALADRWDLDQASYFLLVAATLLDLKAARLLPSGEVDDEEDLALLEARDLLFARLLQYRAYKEAAAMMAGQMAAQGRRFARRVPMEPTFADLLPEVLLGLGPDQFAAIAAAVLAPRKPPEVSTAHLHMPRTTVREQAGIVAAKLRAAGRSSFSELSADCEDTYEIVARFLAVLDLYRDKCIVFEQEVPLGELYVTWTGPDEPPARQAATAGGRTEPADSEHGPAGDQAEARGFQDEADGGRSDAASPDDDRQR